MACWIESHVVLERHRKCIELARGLRICVAWTSGHLHTLWHVVLEQAEDGDISSWSDGFIATSAGHSGTDAPRFVQLLVSHGWVDEWTDESGKRRRLIHDWLDYAGRYLARKYGTANPEKLKQIRAKHKERHSSVTKVSLPDLPDPTHPPARAGARLHGIPATVDDVIAYGKTLRPLKDEDTCREFWSHYEGQARTGPSGDVFWITSGEVVVTNWKEKLPTFGSLKHGNNSKTGKQSTGDRNAGTANEGKSSDYRNVGKVGRVPNAG